MRTPSTSDDSTAERRSSHPSLTAFSAPTAEWFATTFAAPTPCQVEGWRTIAAGQHCLIAAPTGSGKTLAAFLWAIDRIMGEPEPDRAERTRVLYLSPLRALAVDVDKNLRAPLRGISLAAERLGVEVHLPTVGVRTGDTSAAERRRLVTRPPDICITTPESLYLMLTSQARETLRYVRWVIVDEIHSVAATKRGTHLALSLERLFELTAPTTGGAPQRIGLSATQRPMSEVARFLGGTDPQRPSERHVEITDVGMTKQLDVEVIVGVSDMGDLAAASAGTGPGGLVVERADPDDDFAPPAPLGAPPTVTAAPSDLAAPAGVSAPPEPATAEPQPLAQTHSNSIWPAIHPRLLDLVETHRSTIIFVNARRLAERLATRLNELHLEGLNRAAEAEGTSPPLGTELVRAHHGSLSREQRLAIEDDLKAGRVRAIVATSSLELGIDMGAVDLVIQVASPGSVASGLQRIGRAGHQVGEPSVGKIFPRHRGDLVEAAVVAQRMGTGEIESIHYPRQPLDVLAQQIVAMVAVDDWAVADLLAVVRRAAPYEQLSEEVFTAVLDLLAGRYPSEEFRELRPRIVWDRTAGILRARQGAGRLAVTNAGTIPDRGLYAVFTTDGSRVGELDEEMVYEARVGETFLLGASTWRIVEITHDRVVVTPAPGEPGKMPFWHGDGPGRPLELGRAVGAFIRSVADELPANLEAELMRLDAEPSAADAGSARSTTARLVERLQSDHCLDRTAAVNVLRYLDAQRAATGVVPDDRTIVVERFRDEIGDWRVCILTPFGARVHAPWGIALQGKVRTGPRRRRRRRSRAVVERRRHRAAAPRCVVARRLARCWPSGQRIGMGLAIARCLRFGRAWPRRNRRGARPRRGARRHRQLLAVHGAVRVPVPGGGGQGAAAAAPQARRARAAVAAAPALRGPAGGGGEVPELPDAARDVARVPAGGLRRTGAYRGAERHRVSQDPHGHRRHRWRVAHGAEPAVRLDLGLHVRRRRPPWPSDGPQPSHWTASCLPICWA